MQRKRGRERKSGSEEPSKDSGGSKRARTAGYSEIPVPGAAWRLLPSATSAVYVDGEYKHSLVPRPSLPQGFSASSSAEVIPHKDGHLDGRVSFDVNVRLGDESDDQLSTRDFWTLWAPQSVGLEGKHCGGLLGAILSRKTACMNVDVRGFLKHVLLYWGAVCGKTFAQLRKEMGVSMSALRTYQMIDLTVAPKRNKNRKISKITKASLATLQYLWQHMHTAALTGLHTALRGASKNQGALHIIQHLWKRCPGHALDALRMACSGAWQQCGQPSDLRCTESKSGPAQCPSIMHVGTIEWWTRPLGQIRVHEQFSGSGLVTSVTGRQFFEKNRPRHGSVAAQVCGRVDALDRRDSNTLPAVNVSGVVYGNLLHSEPLFQAWVASLIGKGTDNPLRLVPAALGFDTEPYLTASDTEMLCWGVRPFATQFEDWSKKPQKSDTPEPWFVRLMLHYMTGTLVPFSQGTCSVCTSDGLRSKPTTCICSKEKMLLPFVLTRDGLPVSKGAGTLNCSDIHPYLVATHLCRVLVVACLGDIFPTPSARVGILAKLDEIISPDNCSVASSAPSAAGTQRSIEQKTEPDKCVLVDIDRTRVAIWVGLYYAHLLKFRQLMRSSAEGMINQKRKAWEQLGTVWRSCVSKLLGADARIHVPDSKDNPSRVVFVHDLAAPLSGSDSSADDSLVSRFHVAARGLNVYNAVMSQTDFILMFWMCHSVAVSDAGDDSNAVDGSATNSSNMGIANFNHSTDAVLPATGTSSVGVSDEKPIPDRRLGQPPLPFLVSRAYREQHALLPIEELRLCSGDAESPVDMHNIKSIVRHLVTDFVALYSSAASAKTPFERVKLLTTCTQYQQAQSFLALDMVSFSGMRDYLSFPHLELPSLPATRVSFAATSADIPSVITVGEGCQKVGHQHVSDGRFASVDLSGLEALLCKPSPSLGEANQSAMLNAGYPVSFVRWAPGAGVSADGERRMRALLVCIRDTVLLTRAPEAKVREEAETCPMNVIQLWGLSYDPNRIGVTESTCFVWLTHTAGNVLACRWLTGICEETIAPWLLGLVAVSFSNGDSAVYAIPHIHVLLSAAGRNGAGPLVLNLFSLPCVFLSVSALLKPHAFSVQSSSKSSDAAEAPLLSEINFQDPSNGERKLPEAPLSLQQTDPTQVGVNLLRTSLCSSSAFVKYYRRVLQNRSQSQSPPPSLQDMVMKFVSHQMVLFTDFEWHAPSATGPVVQLFATTTTGLICSFEVRLAQFASSQGPISRLQDARDGTASPLLVPINTRRVRREAREPLPRTAHNIQPLPVQVVPEFAVPEGMSSSGGDIKVSGDEDASDDDWMYDDGMYDVSSEAEQDALRDDSDGDVGAALEDGSSKVSLSSVMQAVGMVGKLQPDHGFTMLTKCDASMEPDIPADVSGGPSPPPPPPSPPSSSLLSPPPTSSRRATSAWDACVTTPGRSPPVHVISLRLYPDAQSRHLFAREPSFPNHVHLVEPSPGLAARWTVWEGPSGCTRLVAPFHASPPHPAVRKSLLVVSYHHGQAAVLRSRLLPDRSAPLVSGGASGVESTEDPVLLLDSAGAQLGSKRCGKELARLTSAVWDPLSVSLYHDGMLSGDRWVYVPACTVPHTARWMHRVFWLPRSDFTARVWHDLRGRCPHADYSADAADAPSAEQSPHGAFRVGAGHQRFAMPLYNRDCGHLSLGQAFTFFEDNGGVSVRHPLQSCSAFQQASPQWAVFIRRLHQATVQERLKEPAAVLPSYWLFMSALQHLNARLAITTATNYGMVQLNLVAQADLLGMVTKIDWSSDARITRLSARKRLLTSNHPVVQVFSSEVFLRCVAHHNPKLQFTTSPDNLHLLFVADAWRKDSARQSDSSVRARVLSKVAAYMSTSEMLRHCEERKNPTGGEGAMRGCENVWFEEDNVYSSNVLLDGHMQLSKVDTMCELRADDRVCGSIQERCLSAKRVYWTVSAGEDSNIVHVRVTEGL